MSVRQTSSNHLIPPGARTMCRKAIVWAAALLLACSAPLELPPGEATPYVQALLDPGSPVQYIWVTRGSPADSTVDYSIRPVDPSRVSLCLGPGSGPCITAVPSGTAGRFEVQLAVLPGSTYVLRGRVESDTLDGSVTLPGILAVASPAGDTLHLTGAVGATIQYSWSAPGAAAYGARFSGLGGNYLQALRDTAGEFGLYRFADTMQLEVRGYETQAAGFLLTDTPGFSLHGIAGFLGGVTSARRFVVIWDD